MRWLALILLTMSVLLAVPLHSSIGESVAPNAPAIPVESHIKPQIGAFFYVWYGFNETSRTFTGGNGTSHWNAGPMTAFKDKPLWWYSSNDNITLAWQLNQMHEANLDFIVVSWWGPHDYTDIATKSLFRYVHATNDSVKLAIMIEPYHELNITSAVEYVWNDFYVPYIDHIFEWEGRPLLVSFLPVCPAADSRFTMRTTGNARGCTSWVYVAGTKEALDDYGGDWTPAGLAEYTNSPFTASDGEVTVMPRFDNYFEYTQGGRANYLRFDLDYSHNMLQAELAYAYDVKAKLIVVTSYNEYTEGSMLETHYNAAGQLVEVPSIISLLGEWR